jgi:O-antigen ligase
MIGLIFYFVILFREKIKLKNVGVITIILLSLIFIWISYSDIIFTNPTINKIIPNAGRLSITSAKGMGDRIKIYSAAWQLFKNKPFFGLGTGGFPGGGYPHNIILEIAAENGLLGLLIFFGFLFTICQRGYQFLNDNFIKINKQAKIMGLIILVISVSLFVGRQFSFGLDMHKDLFVFLGLIVNLPLIDWGRNQGEMFLDKD